MSKNQKPSTVEDPKNGAQNRKIWVYMDFIKRVYPLHMDIENNLDRF